MDIIDARLFDKRITVGTSGDRNIIRTIFNFVVEVEEGADSTGNFDEALIRFRVGPYTLLEDIKVFCSSADFDISVRDRAIEDVDTMHEVYVKTASNKRLYETFINIPVVNKDDLKYPEPYLYMVFTNNGTLTSGLIEIELTVSQI
jgi:hypothetical protein